MVRDCMLQVAQGLSLPPSLAQELSLSCSLSLSLSQEPATEFHQLTT
jgi:hypothetical protein